MFASMRKKAAQMGANAIILDAINEASEDCSVGHDRLSLATSQRLNRPVIQPPELPRVAFSVPNPTRSERPDPHHPRFALHLSYRVDRDPV